MWVSLHILFLGWLSKPFTIEYPQDNAIAKSCDFRGLLMQKDASPEQQHPRQSGYLSTFRANLSQFSRD